MSGLNIDIDTKCALILDSICKEYKWSISEALEVIIREWYSNQTIEKKAERYDELPEGDFH